MHVWVSSYIYIYIYIYIYQLQEKKGIWVHMHTYICIYIHPLYLSLSLSIYIYIYKNMGELLKDFLIWPEQEGNGLVPWKMLFQIFFPLFTTLGTSILKLIQFFSSPVSWGSRIYHASLQRGKTPTLNGDPGYDIKQSDNEAPVMLEPWWM